MKGLIRLVASCCLAALLCAPSARAQDGAAPLVIAHRGASGYLPEHTFEAYELAIELGADYIEPDLVATKDGVLIARHEPNLALTTNVATLPQFAHRKRTATIDGVTQEGYFASDFTWAEISEHIRAVQRFAERDRAFDGRFRIPSLDQVIELAQRKGRTVGIYPETKHPGWHREQGLALEDRLIAVLQRRGWNRSDAPVYIQSFEPASLKALRPATRVRLVQLVGNNNAELLTPQGLAEVRRYADGIGPWKGHLIPSVCLQAERKSCDDAERKLLAPTEVVKNAKALGLVVHPYTFRNEPRRLAGDFAGNPVAEYLAFYELGVDGVFSDFPDTARLARALWRISKGPDTTATTMPR
jgi:glycerophosphoryl diester phosphodiesterase